MHRTLLASIYEWLRPGGIFVLEVNSSCDLDKNGEFAMAAAAGGLDDQAVIDRIVETALSRYH